jgi:hypothetical protein
VEDTKGGRERDVSGIHEDASVTQKKWETISEERAEECLREAMRRGSKPLNTSRLNIVGEGRAGKTALLRAVSNKAFEDTTSTIGVKQSLLEVNKVDLETKCGGGWSVVEEGTLIMKADEAMTRLAAEIAITEPRVYMHDPPQVGTKASEDVYYCLQMISTAQLKHVKSENEYIYIYIYIIEKLVTYNTNIYIYIQ